MTREKGFSSALAGGRPATLLPALLAIGGACGLATQSANALELGDLQIDSTLGQPLRASVAFALAANEDIQDYCIYLRPPAPGGDIPSVSQARISVSGGRIVLTGQTPVREPLLGLRLAVDCPYSPHLVRDYTVMLDPGRLAEAGYPRSAPAPLAAEPPARPTAPAGTQVPEPATPRGAPATVTAADRGPVRMNADYRVQRGDSASTIASRIENRPIGLWPAVNAIVDANPQAFVDGDVNRLKAGSTLHIPDMHSIESVASVDTAPAVAPTARSAPVPAADNAAAPVETAPQPDPAADTVRAPSPPDRTFGAGLVIDAATTESPEATTETVAQAEPTEPAAESVAVASEAGSALPPPAPVNLDDLQPGDVVMPAPRSAPPTSAKPAAPAATPAATTGAWGWLFWLGGTGIAMLLGLVLFGRALRERFRPSTPGLRPAPAADSDDAETRHNPIVGDVDFNFDDPAIADDYALDADLGAGTGLESGATVEVAGDFGFSGTAAQGAVDFEFDEDDAREPEMLPTDVIPPTHRADELTILDEEVPPEDGSGTYDMSMIIDATKQDMGDPDDTAQELNAVPVAAEDYIVSDDTLTSEVDLRVLEQDYEDELTATQALNKEIEKAARELANRMDEQEPASADDDTREMPPQEAADDDLTSRLPAGKDEDLTAEMTANIAVEGDAENDDSADSMKTVEMVAAGSDVTVELQVESGKVDTKKGKKDS